MDTMKAIMEHPAFLGAIGGFVAALKTDYDAFKGWKSWDKFKTYDWGIASFRWFQGVVYGALSVYGLSSGARAIFG